MDVFRLLPEKPSCQVLINDIPLLDLVKYAEQRFSGGDYTHYRLLPPRLALLPSLHLLGEPNHADPNWGHDWEERGFGVGKLTIGGCACGEVACRPLLATIDLQRGTVIWRDFVTRWGCDYGLTSAFSRRRYITQLMQ